MPRMLEIVFQSFKISNFSLGGGGGMPPDLVAPRPCGPLSIPLPTLLKLAAHFNFIETPDTVLTTNEMKSEIKGVIS